MRHWWQWSAVCCSEAKPTHDVLVVGENNPHNPHPAYALFPAPKNAAGHRLMTYMGITQLQFMGLWRANLCGEGWSRVAAQSRAEELHDAGFRAIIMLGVKVASSFGYEGKPFTYVPDISHSGDPTLIYVPHPSGLNRLWNDKRAPEKLRCLLRAAIPGFLWGQP